MKALIYSCACLCLAEGFALPHALRTSFLAGSQVTDIMRCYIRKTALAAFGASNKDVCTGHVSEWKAKHGQVSRLLYCLRLR